MDGKVEDPEIAQGLGFELRFCCVWAEESHRSDLVQVVQNHGVGDGIRTRDVQIHSLALYQLSYTHHNCGVRWQVA